MVSRPLMAGCTTYYWWSRTAVRTAGSRATCCAPMLNWERERGVILSRLRTALTENQPAAYAQGTASLSLFQTMVLTKTAGNLSVPCKYGFLCDKSAQDLYILDYIDLTRRTRWKIYQGRKRMQHFW
jgi:hypothetical protein